MAISGEHLKLVRLPRTAVGDFDTISDISQRFLGRVSPVLTTILPIRTRYQSADRICPTGSTFSATNGWRLLESRCGALPGLDVPHAVAVVADRAVRGELSHARCVEDRLARPRLRVAPERAHSLLRFDVGLVIGEEQERIMIEEILDDRAK